MKKKILCFLTVLTMALNVCTYAHQGRTDSSGGHHDYKNKSGLGSYHYHHGYEAHLHPNGVCPYEQASAPAAAPAPAKSNVTVTPKPVLAPVVKIPTLNATDIRTFINGQEIPTFVSSESGSTMVIVEDLCAYGFNVRWDGNSRTLTVEKAEKQTTPIPMDYYRSFKKGQNVFKAENTNVKIILKANGNEYEVGTKASANGYTAIVVDDLSVFGSFSWNGSDRLIDIITK